LEIYWNHLQDVGKKQLVDNENSTVVMDHDCTHVIFGLDSSVEQEMILDRWTKRGTSGYLKYVLDFVRLYLKNLEIREAIRENRKNLIKELGYLTLLRLAITTWPKSRVVHKRAKKMKNKWGLRCPQEFLNKKICDLRNEYGIVILKSEEIPKMFP
tara:strand:+ start:140 stop:607 length:468 start_codon:yes stop_codon:yes gene_type:complete